MARILIVDDSKIMNLGMQKDVKAIGHEAIGVFNGLEAVKKIQKEQFDLILMDIEMPEMDGFEATKKIREITQDSFIPIIIVSTLEETETLDMGWLEAGADEFLHKPFERSALQARVRSMLRLKEKYDELQTAKETLEVFNSKIKKLVTQGLGNMRDPLDRLNKALGGVNGCHGPDSAGLASMRREVKKIEEIVENISQIHRKRYTKVQEL
ncbi:MAG: response regulator [Nitrospinae bacterium]|nr:response regulator [Nitrospinota bacterium]